MNENGMIYDLAELTGGPVVDDIIYSPYGDVTCTATGRLKCDGVLVGRVTDDPHDVFAAILSL